MAGPSAAYYGRLFHACRSCVRIAHRRLRLPRPAPLAPLQPRLWAVDDSYARTHNDSRPTPSTTTELRTVGVRPLPKAYRVTSRGGFRGAKCPAPRSPLIGSVPTVPAVCGLSARTEYRWDCWSSRPRFFLPHWLPRLALSFRSGRCRVGRRGQMAARNNSLGPIFFPAHSRRQLATGNRQLARLNSPRRLLRFPR